jgi:23S rRNA pseudouridine2605 synthase
LRLAKYLAHAGVASRRAAERLIADGKVRVGGEVVTDPARDVDAASDVEVDGRPVEPEPREVWAVNKPKGVVSTARTFGGHKNRRRIERRRAVTQLVDSPRRLYPVGRLDADSAGLILLTNDGELANRLTHPRYGVRKAYLVELARPPSEEDLERLRQGVELEDGPTAAAEVERLGERELEITIREGRKRQVRRMAEAVGNQVEDLTRIRIGPLELGDLRRGEARRLDGREIDALWKDSAP